MSLLKRYKYSILLSLAALFIFGNCSDDFLDAGRTGVNGAAGISYTADGELRAQVAIEIPGMTTYSTRSMSGTPNYDDLKLYVLVFEEGEGLRQCEPWDASPHQGDTEHGHGELVNYDLSLAPTLNRAVVHLVATDQPDFESKLVYGTEDRVMTELYSDDNHEAYWQRIDLDGRIPSQEESVKELGDERFNADDEAQALKIKQLLSHVPMIRNFCSVSVELSERAIETDRFTLTGIYAVNTVDKGSVAPYVAANEEGRRFVEYADGIDSSTGRYKGKSYDGVSAQGHIGTLPAGVKIINTVAEAVDKYAGNVSPVYFYERPARENSTERTYIIIKGRCGTGNDKYYKIDLGRIRDEDVVVGNFTYFNLLRNFNYVIKINSVTPDAGYDTFEEAARGAVFNNFGAAVEARNMTNIGDGTDMIRVNFTSYVFTTNDEKVLFKAQYRTNINNGTGGVVSNNLLNIKWDTPGGVIRNVTEKATETDENGAWRVWEVTGPAVPTDVLEQQVLYVYRGKIDEETYGLYRVITFFSHTPWQFLHMDTFPGSHEEKDPDWTWTDNFREIGSEKDAELTLFFELPGGLPQAIFPLDFAIEADRQNIQNAYVGNAVVSSVEPENSLFATNPTLEVVTGYNNGVPIYGLASPTTARVQYVKTVTWENYFGGDQELVGKGSSIVRARFLTITDLAHELIGTSTPNGTRSTTTLRVGNPYFRDLEGNPYQQDGFERVLADNSGGTGGNQGSEVSLTWDFSDSMWDNELANMNSRYTDTDTYYNNYPLYGDGAEYNGLRFIDGKTKERVRKYYSGMLQVTIDKPTLTSGTYQKNGTNYRYVELYKTRDTFYGGALVGTQELTIEDIIRRKQTYRDAADRTIKVRVMSSNDANNPVSAVPRVRVTNSSGGTVYDSTSPKSADNSTNPFATYTFEISLSSSDGKEFNIDVMNPNQNSGLRIFKIIVTP